MLRKPERIAAAVLAAAVLTLTGCSQDISGTIPTAVPADGTPETTTSAEPASKATETTTSVTSTVTTPPTTETSAEETPEGIPDVPETQGTTVDTAGTADTTTTQEIIEIYKNYVMTDEYNDFISKCVFVGDSICSGLKAYDILPAKSVLAQGNVAARSIYDYTFRVNGDEMSILAALLELRPEYVIFSMGMNDVNMTSEATFCENYGRLLSEVESFLPDTTLIVCSVTPITYGETGRLFTDPAVIDSFNAALKEYLDETEKWIYCDITHDLKNSLNLLKSQYLGSPDGVHLAPEAYYAILYQICERMVDGRIYNADGTYTDTKETDDAKITTSDLIDPPAVTPETTSGSSDPLSGTIILEDLD